MPPPDLDRPDAETKGIRFGCGAIFGLFLGVGSTWATWHSFRPMIAAAIVSALVCGLLAMRFGETFWEKVSSWSWWW